MSKNIAQYATMCSAYATHKHGYELKDWDLFQCKELDKGKPWDGHTSKDVRRLLSIPAAVSVPQWISVKDRLPKYENPVLAGNAELCFVNTAWYHEATRRWELPSGIFCEVTHWMPLPELPKGETE